MQASDRVCFMSNYSVNSAKKRQNEFTQLLRECERASAAGRLECRQRAVALYRGDLLEGCDDCWCQELRAYYQDLYLKALMKGDRSAALQHYGEVKRILKKERLLSIEQVCIF